MMSTHQPVGGASRARGSGRKRRRSRRALPLAAAASLLLAGGCDLPVTPEGRSPNRVELLLPSEPITVSESAPLVFRVFGGDGEAIPNLPPWAVPLWTADPSRVQLAGGRLEARRSGTAIIELSLAGLSDRGTLRINPEALRVQVARAYVTQAIQPLEGGLLPLVAGRGGHLRVFLTGDQDNFFRPTVRAHFYRHGEFVTTLSTNAWTEGVPLHVQEGQLERSWNVPVPASLLVPGASYLIEISEDGGLTPGPGSVLTYPPAGAPLPLDVREVAPFRITFVPIHVIGGPTGNVTAGNVSSFMDVTERVWPLGERDVRVRAAYSTNTGTTTPDDWQQLLRELRTLRIAEGSARYYHGILRRQGGSLGGLAYVGYPAALSFDVLPVAGEVVAHELGHNFGRRHAACGGPAPQSLDPGYPHPQGSIGAYGLAPDGTTLYPPQTPDVMSYCRPVWVSDHNYGAVFAFREAEAARAANGASTASRASQNVGGAPAAGEEALHLPALIVSGEIGPGGARIDPAFTLATRPALPRENGPYALEGLDAAGAVLFSLRFSGEALGDGPEDLRHFAFAVPLAEDALARLTRLRLSGDGHGAERLSTVGPARRAELQGAVAAASADPASAALQGSALGSLGMAVEAGAPGLTTLRWDADRFPVVWVRDPATGRVLARLSGGAGSLRTDARELELHLSEGVTSLRLRVPLASR